MSRFKDVLSDAASRLTVPEPARSRILLEVAADMEDLYQTYLDRGLTEDDARAGVVEQFDLSEEVLQELVRVHDSPLQRSLETLSGQVQGGWARGLLGLLVALVVLVPGRLLFQPQLYQTASDLVWILLPLLLVGLGTGFWKVYRFYLTDSPWAPSLKDGLGYLLGLSFLQIALAFAGLWIELYLAALRIRGTPGEATIQVVGWVHSTAATLVVALSGAVILGCFWFFLEAKAQRMEKLAAARLLEVTS